MISRQEPGKSRLSYRLWIIFFNFFYFNSCFLCSCFFYLQVVKHNFLKQHSQERSTRNILLPAVRGSIFDRHGEPLAISAPIYSVFINPKKFILDKK
ncbi:hypothetical protein BGC07_09175 [Piscirickettsia litoralis]|uniref:Penicillin-binding protein dimerisation domain-containing protein n=1 Tax=Piscirickettsia litoralis TaxID=1891921 RepID=A0ABX3A5T4_9GAMM|nr:hypothetical protein BGC07_09175 [Piscirickettsia litoralis]